MVVEIDGSTHEIAERQAKDSERVIWSRRQGFRVLRLPKRTGHAATELA